MADENRTPRNLELELRKRRRSYYGFRREYPGADSTTMTHSANYEREMQGAVARRRVKIVVLAILAFLLAFIFTATAMQISMLPV